MKYNECIPLHEIDTIQYIPKENRPENYPKDVELSLITTRYGVQHLCEADAFNLNEIMNKYCGWEV